MALPAHLIWERTRAFAGASYPQLSAPDGFEFAGVRRPNDPSLPHVRYELPDGEDVTTLAEADGVDMIAANPQQPPQPQPLRKPHADGGCCA